tara:strand:+ start:1312 stop:1527 length:216 start_codon:yes stop_codon:yes gene_type:complete
MERVMHTVIDEKLIKVLGLYLNEKLGNKVGIGFQVVEIKGTLFLKPELPEDDKTIERLTTSIARRVTPVPV